MTATIGDNQPPALEAFSMAIDDWMDEAKNHLDGKEIENQAQADDLGTILKTMKELARDAEKARKAEKQPHLDAGKAVDASWKPYLDKAKLVIAEATKPLTAWRTKVQAEKDAEAQQLREEAEAAERKAQEARKEAASLEEAEQAEAMLQQADKAKKTANKIDRAPTGLRTTWEVEVTDYGALLAHYKSNMPDRVKDWLAQQAQRDVNGGVRMIPGVIVHERKRAA